jgi:hypothetical protein
VSVTCTAAEVNVLHSVTPGTAKASGAVVLDANKALDTISIAVGGLLIGASGAGVSVTCTAAEVNVLHSVTPGTARASSALVLDANASVNVLQATTTETVGGTGVAGAAATATKFVKVTTAIADNTATPVMTITIPNAAHAASILVRVVGSLGAGGAIGAFEASASNSYVVTIARTTGVNAVGTVSAVFGAAAANVAGAATVTSTCVLSAVSGAVGASNGFTVNATVTKSGGASTNHQCLVVAEVLNSQATGITLS